MRKHRLQLRTAASAAVLLAVVAVAGLPAVAQAPRDVPIAEFDPLPAAGDAAVSDAARALRDQLLGPDALDPAHVRLWWYGVSSFIAAVGGHLLLFDAWEIVGVHADYVPMGREHLAGLEPEAILIGHGHFDHAADAGYVAGLTGATIVASQEICDRARSDARYDGVAADFPCAITGTASQPPPGTTQQVRLFADVEPVTVLQHIHSAASPPGEDNEPDPFAPVFGPAAYLENPNTSPAELARFLYSLSAPQGGTWMYHFRVGDLTLLWGDSAGPIYTNPDVQEALATLPGCVDVMSNAILGFNQPVSGLKDPRLYVEHAAPQVFLPTHGDAWAPGISAGQEAYREELMAQLATLDHPPEVDFLVDPQDYLVARSYRVDDPRWRTAPPGSRCADAAEADVVAVDDPPAPPAAAPPPPAHEAPRPLLPATGAPGALAVAAAVALLAGAAASAHNRRG